VVKRVELLTGDPQEGETRRARLACNDYLRLGPGRSFSSLIQSYGDGRQKSAPSTSKRVIERWSSRFGWQARAETYDAELERQKNEAEAQRRAEILGTGFALQYERVSALKDIAGLLLDDIRAKANPEDETFAVDTDTSTDSQRQRPGVWLRDVKQIGAGEEAEKVAIVRFNAAIFDKFYQALDDIAKEVGERVTKTETTLDGNLDLKHGVDSEQYQRAVATLADALRTLLPGTGVEGASAVGSAEPSAVAGRVEPGG
jgi:hypothetical protein